MPGRIQRSWTRSTSTTCRFAVKRRLSASPSTIKKDASVSIRTDDLPEIIECLGAKAFEGSNRRIVSRVGLQRTGSAFRKRLRVHSDAPDGGRVEITPLNPGLAGRRVETGQGIGRPGTHALIQLVLDAAKATLPARFVRRTGCRVAFQFDESINDGQLDPPSELVVRFRSIEMPWRSRVRWRHASMPGGRAALQETAQGDGSRPSRLSAQ